MAKTIDDGGPAFPHANPGYDGNWDKRRQIEGMSLRDWFAGQAAAAEISAWANSRPEPAEVAAFAYAVADAMLAARKQEHQQ